jgi:hypothetical protein
MPRRLAIAVLALTAGLAACGDDGPTVDPEADEELIEDALLTLDDLPDGFEETPVDDDEDGATDICNDEVLGLDDDEVDDAKTAETDSVQFDSPELSIRAQITAFESNDVPEQILDGLVDDEYLDCLAEAFEEQEFEGVDLGSIEAVDPLVDGDEVDAAAAVRIRLDVESATGPVEAEVQLHGVLVDRFGVFLQGTGVAGEVDEDLLEDVLDEMLDRLADG